MDRFPFDIVGFDLDGTLIDTSGDIAAAVNHALALGGRGVLSEHAIRTMIGGGAKALLIQALEAEGGYDVAEFRQLYRALLDHYSDHLDAHSRPFHGAVAALDDLAAHGVTVGVVTNKFERFAVELLTRLGLVGRFACVIGGDTLGPGRAKPSPDPILELITRCGGGRAAFVGDSIYDIAAAKAAGVSCVAVRFGFGADEELNADATIDRFDQLIPALCAI